MNNNDKIRLTIGISLTQEAIILLKEYSEKWGVNTGTAIARILKEYDQSYSSVEKASCLPK